MICYQLLQRDDSAVTWMQKLRLRTDRDSAAAAEKPRQKDSRRSHSVDSERLLRPKTKSKTSKSPSRKSTKVLLVCHANNLYYIIDCPSVPVNNGSGRGK